jgi:hypothetical protein
MTSSKTTNKTKKSKKGIVGFIKSKFRNTKKYFNKLKLKNKQYIFNENINIYELIEEDKEIKEEEEDNLKTYLGDYNLNDDNLSYRIIEILKQDSLFDEVKNITEIIKKLIILRDFTFLDDFFDDYEFIIRKKNKVIKKLEKYGLLVIAFEKNGYRSTNTLFSKAIQQAINERTDY